mgnify:CR=1 FL=1
MGRSGLRRLFRDDILQRLALISLGQAAGLSLDDMARMFAPDGTLFVSLGDASRFDRVDPEARQVWFRAVGIRPGQDPYHVHYARANFDAFPRSARRGILEWITQAKKPETRAKRVEETARLAQENVRANQWRP